MATPRSKLVDAQTPLFYHLISRCVRRSWLCGFDSYTQTDYSHRKQCFIERMHHLARCFAVEVHGYCVMSNHVHMVVYYDPKAYTRWSSVEVVNRWVRAFPRRRKGKIDEVGNAVYRERLLQQPAEIERMRAELGCLSKYMKYLKQPIAYAANREDGCTGHFFESRFYSGALLSDDAAIAAMAYVDLNPVRAKLARSLQQCANTAIAERLSAIENTQARIDKELEALVGGIECEGDEDTAAEGLDESAPTPLARRPARLHFTERAYIDLLRTQIRIECGTAIATEVDNVWTERIARNAVRRPAYGNADELAKWRSQRGL